MERSNGRNENLFQKPVAEFARIPPLAARNSGEFRYEAYSRVGVRSGSLVTDRRLGHQVAAMIHGVAGRGWSTGAIVPTDVPARIEPCSGVNWGK